jgi:hypothetical protein
MKPINSKRIMLTTNGGFPMTRKGRTLIALIAAVLITLPAATALASDPPVHSAKHRSCGHFRAGKGYKIRFHVTIERGHVRCRTARRVLRKFMNGGGRMHGPRDGPAYRQYWTIGRWRCGHGAGGGACVRHGKNYRTARDYIAAQS